MRRSGRRIALGILPLLLLLGACDNPVAVEVVEEEPEEVETCEWLIPIGIDLVNDYFYTLEETDLAVTQGDSEQLPTSLIALNARGADLDQRAEELDCDLAELNTAIAAATEGLESADPVVNVFLETVRGGVLAAAEVPVGTWVFIEGAVDGEPIELAPDQEITLVVTPDGTASGFTGCNEYWILEPAVDGEWPIGGFDVSAGPCPSEAHAAVQQTYLEALRTVGAYTIEDNVLVLEGSAVDLRFAQADAAD